MQYSLVRATFSVLVTFALFAPVASAAQPHCGDKIKKDVKLTKNLNCNASGGNGLKVGANDVDINLNGHTITGPDGSYDAIDNSDGFDGLTVRNGTLRGFYYGVYSYYGSKLKVTKLQIKFKGTNSGYGVYAEYGNGLRIDQVDVDNSNYGFYFYDNTGLKLTRSKATNNSPTATYGIYDSYSTGTVDRFKAFRAEYGVYLSSYTNHYLVKRSTLNKAGYTGIYVSNSTPLFQYNFILSRNTANDAGSYGFYASYDVKGGGNKAKGAGTKNFNNVPH